jgi:hypothetical protein
MLKIASENQSEIKEHQQLYVQKIESVLHPLHKDWVLNEEKIKEERRQGTEKRGSKRRGDILRACEALGI